jgi:mRNA interferase MazF
VDLIQQGQIWWGELPHEKARPFLILTRQSAVRALEAVVVAPVTSNVRNLPSEVSLGAADGLRRECVANFDALSTMRRAHLTRPVGKIAPGRWHEVCEALRAAIDC